MTQTPDSVSTVEDKLKGVIEEFNLDRCDVYEFHTLCDPANQKELSEKILIALGKEWGDVGRECMPSSLSGRILPGRG